MELSRLSSFDDRGSSIESETLELYHGSDHIVRAPLYNYGKEYNDYGVGFIQHVFLIELFLGQSIWEVPLKQLLTFIH